VINMIIKTIKVSDKGQIAIPKNIRKELEIKTGDELVIVQQKNKLLIEKTESLFEAMKEDFIDITKANEETLKKVWDNEKDEIWNKYNEL